MFKLIDEAQSVDSIAPLELYSSMKEGNPKPIMKFLRRGGKFRTIICGVKEQKEISKLRIFQSTKDIFYQVRYTPRKLVAAFIIFDRQKLWIDTRPGIQTYEQPNLFTNSPIIVELAVRYFEREWKEAKSV